MSMWQRRIFLSVFLSPSGPRLDSLATHLFPAAPGRRPAIGPPSRSIPVPESFFYLCHATTLHPIHYIFFYFILLFDPTSDELGCCLRLSLEMGLCLSLSFLQLVLIPLLSLSLSHSLSFVIRGLLFSSPPPLLYLSEKRFASRLTKKLESRIEIRRRDSSAFHSFSVSLFSLKGHLSLFLSLSLSHSFSLSCCTYN